MIISIFHALAPRDLTSPAIYIHAAATIGRNGALAYIAALFQIPTQGAAAICSADDTHD